jgi:NDP-sugar pyrophosphorylase family protein
MRHIAGDACPYTLPIGGRPLIARAVKKLRDAGASEVMIAVSAQILDEVAAAVGDPGIELHYAVHQSAEDDETLLEAGREALGPGPIAVHPGDVLLPDGVGLSELDAGWIYDGTVDGVLEANQIALDELKRSRLGANLANTSVQGRVQIDPTAVLEGAKLRGPVYIGPGAVLNETYVGPYTSVGENVRLEGVEIEHSIVLPWASIEYPGQRIEASLVGEGAHIGRDFSLPSALRLRVGRGANIQLS